MEQAVYERLREKIHQRGIQSLTNSELLQVIIGSGSKRFPVGRLARAVDRVIALEGNQLSYNSLSSISGIGDATACRILAALQIGHRYASSTETSVQLDTSHLSKSKRKLATYITCDGNKQILNIYTEPINEKASTTLTAKHIYAKALADGAHSITVAVGSKSQVLEAGVFDLGLLHDLQEVSKLLGIHLNGFILVNAQSQVGVL